MNIGTHDDLCRQLVSRSGCNMVSIEYRLAPETRYPGAIDDCYAALCWVSENPEKVGADPSKLGVIGDSAGANLAAAVALRSRDENGPKVGCQVLTYPAVDAALTYPSIKENATGYLLEKADMDYFYNHYIGEADVKDPYLSPIYAGSFNDLPETLVITAEFDPLRDEGQDYAKKLRDSGIATEHRMFEGTIHGFLLFPQLLPQAVEAFELEADFIKRTLG